MKFGVTTAVRCVILTCCLTCVLSKPQSYNRDLEPEARFHKRRGNRGGQPCASFNRPGKGRTFFDWPVQLYDVSFNYHYNINCGGGNTGVGGAEAHPVNTGGGGGHPVNVGGGGSHPVSGGGGQIGGGLLGHKKPNKLMNLLALGQLLGGSNNAGSGPTQVQTQTQNLIANIGHLGEGGGGQNPLGGIFGGIFNGGGGSGGSGSPTGGTPVQTTTVDPDDIIYNDDKPVYEEHDDVAEVYSSNFRPSPRPRPGYYQNRYPSGNQNRYQQNSFYNEKFIGSQNYNRRY